MVGVLFSGCHRQRLSQRQMIGVLTDMHRLEGILQISGVQREDEEEVQTYYDAVLAEHHTTRAQFDSSLVWYTNHPQRFNKIYPYVLKNLEAEHYLYVSESERQRVLLEARQKHFEQFSIDLTLQSLLYGYPIATPYLLPSPPTLPDLITQPDNHQHPLILKFTGN